MNRARLLALSIFLGLVATPAVAATVERTALSYEQNEDRSNFIEQVRKARKGDTEAQWQVGSTYVHLGDPVRALSMLQAAASVGHLRAAALLGWLHEEGRGTAENIDEAKRWYLVAAEQGQADAMAALGRLSLQESAPEAQDSAWQWFEKAARLDHPVAQYHLGWILAQRTRAGRDDAGAYAWFLKAAQQGHVGAQVAVATHLLLGRGVATDSKAAGKWLQNAAEKRDPVANYMLGRLREDSGPVGLDEARASFMIAAAAGHREAQFALATLLVKSVAEADRKEAAGWFAKAQEAGHKAASNSLGELYRDGAGDLQQLVLARSIFRRAAKQGDANAMYNLAQLQNQGLGGPRDIGEALEWYTRAAEEGHEKAIEVLTSLLNSSVKSSVFGFKGFWQ